jgi:hypothetical protein
MNLGTRFCSGPLTRRTALKAGTLSLGSGGLGFAGLGLGDILRLQSQAAAPPAVRDRSVIFVWLPGGPPHMEMYDLKPEAPSEYRGDFKPIDTTVPGIQLGELLPLQAKLAHRLNIVRSVAHQFADHGGGHKRFMTGRDPKEPTGFVNDFPAVPSMISKLVGQRRQGMPNYVSGVDSGRQGIDVFSFGSAYLGPAAHPFTVVGTPGDKDFQLPSLAPLPGLDGRMQDRVALMRQFDRLRRNVDASGTLAAMDEFNRRAIDMISSDNARRAFDLALESEALRDRYGRNAYGQRLLMARRLAEAGCTFVTAVLEHPHSDQMPKCGTYNWDSHAVNCHLFDDARWRQPLYDQAVTALIEDLYARGLDRRVLLVVTGEFGRTPRINYRVGTQTGVMQPGRDHWPNAMSLIASGGGMRTGQIIGATNAKGEHPIERPLSPNDLWATMLSFLGINSEHTFPDHAGRPLPILSDGKPIAELLPTAAA